MYRLFPKEEKQACVGAVSTADSIILNLKRMNQVRKLDAADYTMEVEAGCVLSNVQAAAMEEGLYFPLSLGAEGTRQIGGNLSANAGGVNVLRYGNSRDLVLGVEVDLPKGCVWNGLNALRKNSTGAISKICSLALKARLALSPLRRSNCFRPHSIDRPF